MYLLWIVKRAISEYRVVDAGRQLILSAEDPEYVESFAGEAVVSGEGSGVELADHQQPAVHSVEHMV